MREIPTDADLVLAAQAGDAASLGVLLDRHRAAMQAVALGLLGYTPDAQDAVQDAMLIALQRLGDLRDPAAVGAWLRAIVRNACRMRQRAGRPSISDDAAIVGLVSPEPSPDALLDRHALRDWIWSAIQQLSEPLRLVVMLRYFSSVTSYEQIADICGVPVGTIRSRLHQARLKLSDALLSTAGAVHDDISVLTASRRREVEEWLRAADRGAFSAALADSWSADVTIVGPSGLQGRGRQILADVMDSDLEDGVRQRIAHLTASHDLTIIECDLVSPPWDPDHCPAGVIWLLSLQSDQVVRAHLFHPRSA